MLIARKKPNNFKRMQENLHPFYTLLFKVIYFFVLTPILTPNNMFFYHFLYIYLQLEKTKKSLDITAFHCHIKAFSLGAPGGIRTPGASVRSRVLYPAEVRAHFLTTIKLYHIFFILSR